MTTPASRRASSSGMWSTSSGGISRKHSGLLLQLRLNSGFELGRFKPWRSGAAFPGDAAVLADQVKPVRPTRVSELDFVVQVIQHCRELDPEIANAGVGVLLLLIEGLRGFQKDAVPFVGLNLPPVRRVSFANV